MATLTADRPGLQVVFDRFNALYNSRENANITVTCGTREWKIHDLVLTLRSPTLLSKVRSGPATEPTSGTLDLSSDDAEAEDRDADDEDMDAANAHAIDADAVDALLEYLYKFEYDSDTLSLHVKTAALADQYHIDDLRTYASDKFSHCLRFNLHTIRELVAAVKASGVDGPTDSIMHSIACFATTTLSKFDCAQLALENHKLSNHMLMMLLEERPRTETAAGPDELETYTCQHCQHSFVGVLPTTPGPLGLIGYCCAECGGGNRWGSQRKRRYSLLSEDDRSSQGRV